MTSSSHTAFLDGAFTRSGDAITFVRNGVFIDCNDAVLKMFGYPDKAEFLAQNPTTLSPAVQADGRPSDVASEMFMAKAAEDGNVLFEWLHKRRDGTLFPAEVMIILFELDGDQALAVTVRDISERKAAEAEIARQREALHQNEKLAAIGSLLAGVAHELNNPLAILINHAALLQESAPDAGTRERAEKIETAAGRCAKIVRSFLAIARQRPPTYSGVSVQSVIDKALELTGYGLRSSGVSVDVAVAQPAPMIWADEDQIIQVLMNLIINAQQAMDGQAGDRALRIEAAAKGGKLILSVLDSGPGVPEDIRGRVFDPFFTTKAVGSGTGIGLALCRSIVEAHRGSVRVANGETGGARFEVVLPLTKGPQAAPAGDAASHGALDAVVLAVDDEPEIRAILAEILGPMVSRVDTAEDGHAALDLIARGRYDVVVSDLRMPGLDGQSLYERLRSDGSALADRMIFLSGDMLSERNAAFLAGTANPVLEKPFVAGEVRAAVAQLLRATAH